MESCLKCPVTALFVHKEYILSGQGSTVVVYSLAANEKVSTTKLFLRSRIHKFCPSGDGKLYLCIAGRNVQCISVEDCLDGVVARPLNASEKQLADWIWDGICVSGNEWLLVTAHNTVARYNFDTGSVTVISSCAQQCILYSASLQNIDDSIAVGVGTVFNQVLLWKVEECNTAVKVSKTFNGHEGVIFRVRFHPSNKYVLSVSDDRSVRVWQIESESCLRVMYGHMARVWDAQYVAGDRIVSIGEDSICLLWDAEGVLQNKFKGHLGKSIWSLATGRNFAITGGGDGSIRKFDLDQQHNDIEENSIALPTNIAEDYPRHLRLLDQLFVFTNEGLAYFYDMDSKEFSHLGTFTDFRSYSCLSIHSSMVALANLHGSIKIFSLDSNISTHTEVKAFSGKINSIHWLPLEHEVYLLTSGPQGETHVYHYDMHKLEIKWRFEIPHARQRWLTSAVLLRRGSNVLLVCGDRRGSIHLFNTQSQEIGQSMIGIHGKAGVTSIKTHNHSIISAGRDGSYRQFTLNDQLVLTSNRKACKGMDWIEGVWFQDDDVIVYGFFMQAYFAAWSVKRNELLYKIRCGGGYRTWDVLPQPSTGVRFVYVKNAQIFIAKTHSSEYSQVIEEPLHGKEINCIRVFARHSHDEWLMATASEDTTLQFLTYNTKSRQLTTIHSCEGHIGGVKDVAIVTQSTGCSDGLRGLAFSCGSRSSLKCWKFDVTLNSWSLHSEIYNPELVKKKDLLRDKQLIDDMRYLSCTAFPLSEVSIQYDGDNEMQCNGDNNVQCGGDKSNDFGDNCVFACACSDGIARVYVQSGRSIFLLASLHFHKRCVLTVKYVIRKHVVHIVTTATDGFIAVWDISQGLRDFIGRLRDDDDSCSRKKAKVTVPNEHRFKFHALDTSFSGAVVEPIATLHAHQSGVNSIDCLLNENGYTIVSGGEDNSLCISVIDDGDLRKVAHNDYAHHSQITGVKFVSENLFLSTSVDQRIKLWKLLPVSMEVLKEIISDVADVSNLECWHDGSTLHVAVCGIGLQIFSLEHAI